MFKDKLYQFVFTKIASTIEIDTELLLIMYN